MSIARQLELSVAKLRTLFQRANGDVLEAGPAILDDMEAAIEQVRGLEDVAVINSDLLNSFHEKHGDSPRLPEGI